jgi:hypothetical protein
MTKIRLHSKECQEKRSSLFALKAVNREEQKEDARITKSLLSLS